MPPRNHAGQFIGQKLARYFQYHRGLVNIGTVIFNHVQHIQIAHEKISAKGRGLIFLKRHCVVEVKLLKRACFRIFHVHLDMPQLMTGDAAHFTFGQFGIQHHKSLLERNDAEAFHAVELVVIRVFHFRIEIR